MFDTSFLLPPGLHSEPESATASRARRRYALTCRMVEANLSNKLEEMAASIASLTELVKDMPCHMHAVEDRVSGLEGLFVCTPSPTVDEVLDEMLSKSRADRTPDRIHKYAACVDNFSGDGKTQIAEP